MIFESIVVGELGANCFVLGDEATREGIIVDPGAEPEKVLATVNRLGLTIKQVINTHGHFDHIGGNLKVVTATGAELLIHEGDVPLLSRAAEVGRMYGLPVDNSPLPNRFLEDGLKIAMGRYTIEVLHTPGHSPGCCCLYLAEEKTVITGDTLFAEGVGRTDFPGSSHAALVQSITTKLMTLPEETRAYPGHGPSTTIGHEKRHNPYI